MITPKLSFWFFSIFGSVLIILFLLTGQERAYADADFLQPEQAFQFSSRQISPDKIEVTFKIADGYYMYHERFKFSAVGARLGQISIPKGTIKFDETFQKDLETFRKQVTIPIQIASIDKSQPTFTIITQSQGCSDQGLCYVPMESKQTFNAADFVIGGGASSSGSAKSSGSSDGNSAGADSDETSRLTASLKSGNLLLITPLFLLLGLGLAFTPCVLPMVPILSSIIVGEGVGLRRSRGLILSLSYSFGMAIVYTGLGVAAGLLGEGLAASLQNPWVLGSFGLVMVVLSLSMFNVYHLQVPIVIQSKLSHFSGRQRSGKLIGVFVMGAISALIVGPCVAAPLASALLYISQTRDVYIGGTALFSMAMGMSIPLILVGISAGTFLPRVGRWMDSVKQLFGVLMLAMALWLVSPVLPAWLHMAAWSALLIGYGLFLFRHSAIFTKAAALGLCTLGLIEFAGVTTGGRDVLAPFAHLSAAPSHVEFVRISSTTELEKALALAKQDGKPVMLDFYADWCVSCKEMEKFTFTDDRVRSKFAEMILLQADVTANNENDKQLLKRFNLYGPPGMIFFGLDSEERGRVIGFQNADKFMKSLSAFVKA